MTCDKFLKYFLFVILYSEAYRTRVLQESGSAEPGMMHSDIEIQGLWISVVTILQFITLIQYLEKYEYSYLATSGSSHQVQDTDACIQNDHRLSTILLPLTITNLHPLQKSEIC